MIKIILIDADPERLSWLKADLDRPDIHIITSIWNHQTILRSISLYKPDLAITAPNFKKEVLLLCQNIMENCPLPIVVLQDQDCTYDVSQSGAVAAKIIPPAPGITGRNVQIDSLLETIALMHKIPVVKRKTFKKTADSKFEQSIKSSVYTFSEAETEKKHILNISAPETLFIPKNSEKPYVIGIASSTGGTSIVQKIIANLTADYPIPIILSQHLSLGFSETFISSLRRSTSINIKEAENGEKIKPGWIYAACSDHHIELRQNMTLHLIGRNQYKGYCPSGTLMLKSLAQTCRKRSAGIILSGMGNDGAEGLLEIKNQGGITIAQQESTCVVSSMPHQAIINGSASYVLPPEKISQMLLYWT